MKRHGNKETAKDKVPVLSEVTLFKSLTNLITHNEEVTQMKKKNLLTKLITTAMAAALIFANGTLVMTVHAEPFYNPSNGNWYNEDGCLTHDPTREPGGGGGGSIPIDLTNPENLTPGSLYESSSSDSGGGSGESYSAPSDSGSGDSGSGSSDSGSGDSGSGSSDSVPSGDSGSSDDGGSGTPAPSGLATKGSTATIPGSQTFRHIWYPKEGQASIYHCGIEQYTAQLTDADGNAVPYKYASPYMDEATGKWYLNIITEEGVDTTGYTICTWKGTVSYLPKLGMSGVMLNQTLVVDAEAAAEAEAAAN